MQLQMLVVANSLLSKTRGKLFFYKKISLQDNRNAVNLYLQPGSFSMSNAYII